MHTASLKLTRQAEPGRSEADRLAVSVSRSACGLLLDFPRDHDVSHWVGCHVLRHAHEPYVR